jgi:hypothetical protein
MMEHRYKHIAGMNMKILLVCKDIGGYAKKLANYLKTDHEVCFIDTSSLSGSFNWAPKIFRRSLRRYSEFSSFRSLIKASGRFDVALFINPAQIDKSLTEAGLKVSDRKVAYLYDSFSRWPMSSEELAEYDDVFSFDWENAESHGLHKLHNYIYSEFDGMSEPIEYSAFVVMAGKDRVPVLEGLAHEFDRLKITNYKFLVQCKKIPGSHAGITYFEDRMSLESVEDLVRRSKIVIDISKPGQSGLSFRFFEAMAMRKKVITTNNSVMEYDFYNPANILVVHENCPVIPDSFINEPYMDIPADIYNLYTLQGWVKVVFSSP